MKKVCTILGISALLFACSPKVGGILYTPAQTDATDSVSYDELMAGRALYVKKCGSCHNLRLPQNYTEAAWKKNINKMQPKGKITDAEKQTILNFLLVKAKRPS